MKSILIIEDDLNIGNMEEELLVNDGYKVYRAYSGTEALLFLKDNEIDLILLDLMLPGISGENLLDKIKNIPTIVVSAKANVDDKVDMLLSGASDYITKPFDSKELLARIAVSLRNKSIPKEKDKYRYEDLLLDTTTHTVYFCENKINLTKTEFAILNILMQNPKQVIAKSIILDRIFDENPECTENSLKTHISNLRAKLRKISNKEYIESIWGIGFCLKSNS